MKRSMKRSRKGSRKRTRKGSRKRRMQRTTKRGGSLGPKKIPLLPADANIRAQGWGESIAEIKAELHGLESELAELSSAESSDKRRKDLQKSISLVTEKLVNKTSYLVASR